MQAQVSESGTTDRPAGPPVRRPRLLEAGLFLVVVAVPLVFTPFTTVPFKDPKLVLLLTGTFLIASSGVSADRAVAALAAFWVAVLALTTLLGVDFWWSLLGHPTMSTGLLTLAASAVLLSVATTVPDDLREEIPLWIFRTGVVVSVVLLFGRFVDLSAAGIIDAGLSSTVGHRVYVGAFVAVAILAATSLRFRLEVAAGLLVLGSGLAVSAARSAWLGLAIGLIFVVWRGRPGWRRTLAFLLPVAVAMGSWTSADPFLPAEGEIGFSAAPRFTQFGEGSSTARLAIWRTGLRAWGEEDRFLGSGLGTFWGRYLEHVTPREVRSDAERGWGDAHNIVLELGVTTGLLGVASFAALVLFVLWRATRAPPSRAWAAGATVCLAAVHLVQPLNIVLTPLLFLTAGLAVVSTESRSQVRVRSWVAAIMLVGLVLGMGRFAASTLDLYAWEYDSRSSLRVARVLEPGRYFSTKLLAKRVALEARAGDKDAPAEARRLAGEAVARHAWHSEVRLMAADVELLLDSPAGALGWVERHIERFPNDPLALEGAAHLALKTGDEERAAYFARRALEVHPDQAVARAVLEEVTGSPDP